MKDTVEVTNMFKEFKEFGKELLRDGLSTWHMNDLVERLMGTVPVFVIERIGQFGIDRNDLTSWMRDLETVLRPRFGSNPFELRVGLISTEDGVLEEYYGVVVTKGDALSREDFAARCKGLRDALAQSDTMRYLNDSSGSRSPDDVAVMMEVLSVGLRQAEEYLLS